MAANTSVVRRVGEVLSRALGRRQWIVGEHGIGKTSAVQRALRQAQAPTVYVDLKSSDETLRDKLAQCQDRPFVLVLDHLHAVEWDPGMKPAPFGLCAVDNEFGPDVAITNGSQIWRRTNRAQAFYGPV